jgi:hypothetical protein
MLVAVVRVLLLPLRLVSCNALSHKKSVAEAQPTICLSGPDRRRGRVLALGSWGQLWNQRYARAYRHIVLERTRLVLSPFHVKV